jgi:SNF2 family DNA or RNA helicase
MQRHEAAQICRNELDARGLSDWKIKLVTTNLILGKCVYTEKTIYLNTHHIDTHPDVEVVNTIKHEVAHALTPGSGHGTLWKDKAIELGAAPIECASYSLDARAIDAIRSGLQIEVTYEERTIREPKYTIGKLQEKCPTCGKVAVEATSQIVGKKKKIIILKCLHIITKIIDSGSPFEDIIFDGDIKCKHDWNNTVCRKCNAKRLYPYQIESCKFLEKANGRAGIFHEMGLGKTVIGLGWLKYHPEALPCLAIVKSGIKYQWSKEIVRILGFSHMAQVITSSKDALLPGIKIYIISYDMLVPKVRTRNGKTIVSGFDINKFKMAGIKTVILDECQAIKNPDSTRTQMVRRIVRDIPHIIPLSGTPWKNRGSEFFPVLNMLDPIRFGTYAGFLNRWVEYYWDGAHQKMGGIANPTKFKEFTKDILIRNERAEVMKELPTISRNATYCDMDETTSKAYSNEVNDFVKFWNNAVIGGEEDGFETSQGILARLTRMRHLTGLAKIPNTVEFAKEFLEDTDRKLVIFVHHKDVHQIILDQLKQFCIENKIALPLSLTADLTSEARFDVQEKFNSPNYRIMVASTIASGEGLNLQTCSDCIMHERQWNPANEEQAEGRFIRIGQKANAVIATYMLAGGSIDDHFHQLVERKRASFHAAMNNGTSAVWQNVNLVKELAQAIVDGAKGR